MSTRMYHNCLSETPYKRPPRLCDRLGIRERANNNAELEKSFEKKKDFARKRSKMVRYIFLKKVNIIIIYSSLRLIFIEKQPNNNLK